MDSEQGLDTFVKGLVFKFQVKIGGKYLKAATRGHKSFISRIQKTVDKAFVDLNKCTWKDAEAAFETFSRTYSTFLSAVQKWEDKIGALRPAIEVAMAKAEDLEDKDVSKRELDTLEKSISSIETKENEMDKLMGKYSEMQSTTINLLANRREDKERLL